MTDNPRPVDLHYRLAAPEEPPVPEHTVPADGKHVASVVCWCHPLVKRQGTGDTVVVHRTYSDAPE